MKMEMNERTCLDRKAAYAKLKSAVTNEDITELKDLSLVIAKKYSNTLSSKLVALMQSNKRNIDDETFELIRRTKLAGIGWSFGQDDKIQFYSEVNNH